jgi:hypothetical protein
MGDPFRVAPAGRAVCCTNVPKEPRKPQPPPWLTTWTIYKVAAKQMRLGEVEAADEREAIEKAAKEFNVITSRLLAVRRR